MSPDPADREAAIKNEGEKVAVDLLYTEKTHFAAAERLHTVHTRVGLAATLLSAAAAATVLRDWPIATGVLALGAALASGGLTYLKPDQRAANHLASGRQLTALRVELRQLLHLDLGYVPDSDVRTALGELVARKAKIDAAAPSTEERDFRVAKVKIERGDFEH